MTEQKTEQKTLRDEFAMAALKSGWLRNTDIGYMGMTDPSVIARSCYEIADAMLTARNQEAA